MTIEDGRFRKPVVPGDRLHIHVTKLRQRGAVWKFSGEARVDGALMAQARFTAMIMDD
jgi:3-hydroxyacyl-[acyl-carrier-protein] dehydratase